MKKLLLYILISILTGAALWSCLHEFDLRPDEEVSLPEEFGVAEAEAFFETMSPELSVWGVSPEDSNGIPIIPLWTFGKSFEIGDVPTVEVSLNIVPY